MKWVSCGVLVASAALATRAGAAPPKSPAACVAFAEAGQTKRDDGHLVESRADFLGCADDTCPLLVRQDCVRWVKEVEERTPSLIVTVRDTAGKDVMPVEVTLDDVAMNVDTGRPLAVNPGTHLVRARAGAAGVEERVVMVEGEKGRVITLTLSSAAPPAPKALPSPAPTPLREPGGSGKSIPPLTWVLGSAATVSAVGFAYFWANGIAKLHDLRANCAPACDPDEADRMRTTLTIARVSLSLSVAAAIGATITYIAWPSAARDAATASLGRALTVAF
jgi:hypothetical protein